MDTFGERFKQLRLIRNFTQDELVKDFNSKFQYTIGKSAISQYENSKRFPEINILIDFSYYFEVSLDYLLCTKNSENSSIKEAFENYLLPAKTYFELTTLPEEYNKIINSYSNIYFNGNPASEKTIELIYTCLKLSIELAKKEKLITNAHLQY